ncbi:MAG: MFS transporter [Ilumatobacteraceae bacterium]
MTLRRPGTQRVFDLAVLGNFLAIGVLLAAVPLHVREDLGGSKAAVGVATSIFFAAALVARPVAGRWMDRLGRRPFLVWPLAAMVLLAVAMEATSSVVSVVVVRLLQGAFGSVFYTACAAVSTDLAPADKRAGAVARLSLMIYLGFAFGPFLGEWLFHQNGRWPWVAAAVLHLAAFGAARLLPETLSTPSVAAVTAASTLRTYRLVLLPGMAQLCAGLGYSCVVAFLTLYAKEIGLGVAGWLFFTYACSALAVRMVSGRLADRFGYVSVALPGMVVFAGGHLLMAVAWAPWVPFPAIAMTGIGFGAVFPALTALAVSGAPDADRGAALGTFLSFNDLGNAVAGPVVGSIADAAGFRWAYGSPAIVACIGIVFVLALSRGTRRAALLAPARPTVR